MIKLFTLKKYKPVSLLWNDANQHQGVGAFFKKTNAVWS